MMVETTPIYILADDLTGSADAANYFRTKRHRVRVSFSEERPWDFSHGADVVQVYDSESRSIESETARYRVAHATGLLFRQHGNQMKVYKKIDSTMRGNVGAEIESALKGLGRRFAILSPSFPANQRYVRQGRLYVGENPVSQSDFARDPKNPVRDDRISRLVRESTDLPLVECSTSVEVEQVLAESHFDRGILVVDAETEEDLNALSRIVATRTDVLPCGSAGLSKALSEIWVGGTRTDEKRRRSGFREGTRYLVVVGSANPRSHAQLDFLRKSIHAPSIVLSPSLLADESTREQEMSRAYNALAQLHDCAVTINLATERANGEAFVDDLAKVVAPWMLDHHPVGLVATGGDTVLAICRAIGAIAIWPEGEVEPGLPWSQIQTAKGVIPVVSKAGGFGHEATLLHAIQFLMGDDER